MGRRLIVRVLICSLLGGSIVMPGPAFSSQGGKQVEDQRCVLLLHGLGRTSWSMKKMGRALEKEGFLVVNIGYPSRDKPIETLAMEAVTEGLDKCRKTGAVRSLDVVTHSMGGILLRYYLEQNKIEELRRVVMLSPPNMGSEVTDGLMDKGYYRWYNGPAGQQLGTSPDSLVMKLGPVKFSLGIITGNKHSLFDGWLADMIPGENDGKVSVARAQVEGMDDFLVLPYTHTTIMNKPEVIRQTLHFLDNGVFAPVLDTIKKDDLEPARKLSQESEEDSQDS